MKTSTRDRILEAGADIIHHKGFNHTGIQEILTAAGVPKGSFYNFFKNKEDFGLQVIDYFSNHFSEVAKNIIEDRSVPPLERIKGILRNFMDYFRSTNFTRGCPVGNLAQEMGDLSPAFREKLKQALDQITAGYAGVLAEAQNAGEISDQIDVQETANFIVSSWHGALIRMKVVQNLAPLENHYKFVFDYVLKP
jgi:TetR/AcrR family transcriptional repressor of nem operon